MQTEQLNYSMPRLLGGLFLIVFLAYGLGNGLIQSVLGQNPPLESILAHSIKLRLGGFLVLSNTVFVVLIGLLFYPILQEKNPGIALTYLISRVFEGVLLLIGVIALLSPLGWLEQNSLEKAQQAVFQQSWLLLAQKINFYCYQAAIICLALGSLAFCWALLKYKMLARWLAMGGWFGYLCLLLGAVLEFFGVPLGIWFSIPGGLFELSLGLWLIIKGPALTGYEQALGA
jgi:Domain of unknown function (DUF4386)